MKVFVNVCIVATNMMRENAIFISSKLGLLGNAVKIYKTFAAVITSLTLSTLQVSRYLLQRYLLFYFKIGFISSNVFIQYIQF